MDLLLLGIAIALLVTVLEARLISGYRFGGAHSAFFDWWTYSAAVDRWLAGQPIFAPEQLAGPYHLTGVLYVGYAYPPASVPLFWPFASFPVGLVVFQTLNVGSLLCVLWAMASRWWPRSRVRAFAFLLAGLAAWPPFGDGVQAANVNIGIAAIVGLVALGVSDRAMGPIAGFLAVLKVFAGT